MYATPVFTTMGGASKCPGETLTSRRESQVSVRIVSRCGPTRDQPCDESTLQPDEAAQFGLLINNLSPTGKFHSSSITIMTENV